jgi:DNA-directed RNA polymerase subunit omega
VARVTVEDCVKVINNRFELILISAKRAREIASGAPIHVQRDNDKNPVVALREISEHKVDIENLRDNLTKSMQRTVFVAGSALDIDEEITDEMSPESLWSPDEIVGSKSSREEEAGLEDEDFSEEDNI